MKVTACLITWKRQQNLPRIIESLTKWDFINEIIIQDNSKGENIINYGRYVSAGKAKNDLIYVQDDDYINHDIGKLYESVSIKSTHNGFVHSGTADYERDIPNNIHGSKQMALVGWGAIFDKQYIRLLDKYIQIYGKDYCFYRETDRILSILMGKHHLFVPCNIETLPGQNDEHSLHNKDDHLRYKQMAIERALAL